MIFSGKKEMAISFFGSIPIKDIPTDPLAVCATPCKFTICFVNNILSLLVRVLFIFIMSPTQRSLEGEFR